MGEVFILVLHQVLEIEDQETSLLCLNQLQENVITVNNAPRSLPGGDVEHPHSIYTSEADVRIPLKVIGVISEFYTRTPTQYDFSTCEHVVLTSNSLCDPSVLDLDHQENNIENNNNDDLGLRRPQGGCQLFAMHLRTEVSAVLSSVSKTIQDDYLLEKLDDYVNLQLPSRYMAAMSATSNK